MDGFQLIKLSDDVSSNSRQKNCTSGYLEPWCSLVRDEDHEQLPTPKGGMFSLVPRRCVDVGLAKVRRTPFPQRLWGLRRLDHVSVHCLSATGNAVNLTVVGAVVYQLY